MGDGGSASARFRRAIRTGDPLLATAAALELGRLPLDGALALTLLYARSDKARFARAAVRLHGRLELELPQLELVAARIALDALAALPARPETGGRALAAAFDGELRPELAAVVTEWLDGNG